MKITAIVQARTGSTRLPGKVLLDLAGEPMLARVVNRLSRAKLVDEIVVTTTVGPGDDQIVNLCQLRGWRYFRGSEDDLLDRYYRTAKDYCAEVVVRVTSDCPLIEPQVVDKVVKIFLDRLPDLDYASNTLPKRTFPRGLDTEVMIFEALEKAWHEDDNSVWREHVTTYIRNHPKRFKLFGVVNNEDFSYMRWTVDTPEDLDFVRRIYEHFEHDRFSWQEVLILLERHPEWLAINRTINQKKV